MGDKPAADGQMGTDHEGLSGVAASGDTRWLRERLAQGIAPWNTPGSRAAGTPIDGVMEGEQHNTYDIEFYGPNTMMGTCIWARCALQEMASALSREKAPSMRVWRGVHRMESLVERRVLPPARESGSWKVITSRISAATHPTRAAGNEPRYQYGAA